MGPIADIHCHLLPYVDDGAEHIDEMEDMLISQAKQGVKVICFTPHLRAGMFTSTDEDILRRFEQAKEFVQANKLSIRLCLSREYYCDKTFLKKLDASEVLTMGRGKSLLMEFSSRYDMDTICGYIKRARAAGYQPVTAHVERYPAISNDARKVERLINSGARIQVNASSLLGREGLRQKLFSWKLMKLGLVDVVASDAHDPKYRPPELRKCVRKIENIMGQARARKTLWDGPLEILSLK